ncbi:MULTISPECIES: hypothetical protein [Micromonosporaceae]|uniref:hypothetical protein n=1 Tax=Micromonosporaceae TaxID=28056 RepID=UPI002417F2E1|nr:MULTISPECIES: hypothetical protein [Micromonosporaceae]MDG4768765.1 hypothetical protein [Solwaraspora sp. WMMD792]MDG4768807.1 hypothetical protein [Solwaraspora sp. WMMD792]MDG4768973.1 hypothetical protein [Solwaraspora sp. WMMD792]MDG4768998.1 hypothetical protein [Solwaraspora sp. WMMD792]MDG4805153.1 hypothetical protein [Micromonospora sp. WMMD1120]
MTFLSRDQILGASDRTFDEVPVPEWGGTVRIRSISGAERDSFEQSLLQQRGRDRKVNMRNARAKLIVLCAVDGTGRKMFTEDDIAALSRKNAKPLDRIYDACQRIAGLSDDDVDELTADFDSAQSDSSATD